MAITCWAPGCNHNNVREKCRFYRFPQNEEIRRKWLTLLGRDAKPTVGSRVCSCHFLDGKKENSPGLFQPHYLTAEKKTRKAKPIAKGVPEIYAAELEEFEGLSEPIEATASTSTAKTTEVITPQTEM